MPSAVYEAASERMMTGGIPAGMGRSIATEANTLLGPYRSVLSAVTTVPQTGSLGDSYISPNGAYATQIALFGSDGSWHYSPPFPGDIVYVQDVGLYYIFLNGSWSRHTSTISVLTIAAMVALGALSAYFHIVYVESYAVLGDGGGGIFIWSPASIATTNTGTIFAATGVSTGRWLRQYDRLQLEFFNVSTVDDSTAFTNAVAFAASAGISLYALGASYTFRHNITSLPGVAVHGAGSSAGAGSNTIFDFTNNTDGGYGWSIIGTGGFGTYTQGNIIEGILLIGNSSGVGLNAHGQGLYVSRTSGMTLRDMKANYFKGPGIFIGSNIQIVLERPEVFGCGTSTTGAMEIDGETSAGTEYVGTTLSIYDLRVEFDAGNNAQAGLKIDRWLGGDIYGGDVESSGLLLMMGSKASSIVGVEAFALHGIDFESPSNGASNIATFGTGWLGAAGRGIVSCGIYGGTPEGGLTAITSMFVIKESTGWFCNNAWMQNANSGSTVFDFQGTNNFHQNVNSNDVKLIADNGAYTYVKVNGSTIAAANPALPWSIDNEPVLVANLPSAATSKGRSMFVLDSNATLAAGLGNIVVGTGAPANFVPVYSDGTNWIIG